VAPSPSRASRPSPSRLLRAAGLLNRLRPRTRLAVVACALWLLGAWHVAVAPIGPLSRLDLALADIRLALALPPVAKPRDDIVIVDIDDASLRELGRWPWPRERLAGLVATLFDDDRAAALGIDLLFAEPDDQGRAVGDALRELDRLGAGDAALRAGIARWQDAVVARADHDAALAQALAGRPVTLAYHFNHVPPAPGLRRATMQAAAAAASAPDLFRTDLPEPLTEPGVLPASALAMTPWQGIEVPVAQLLHASAGTGFINSLPDADGELRATPLVTTYGGAVYESFGLSLWRQWRRVSVARPVVARGAAGGPPRLTALMLADEHGEPLRTLRVDERGAVVLPYRRAADPGASRGSGRFRYIGAADVLAHRVGRAELEGRLVLLGSSAPGLTDLRATPVHQALPGIEVHAQLLAGLEDADLGVQPDWAAAFMLLVLAGVLAAVAAIVRRLAGPAAVVALAVLVAVLLSGDLAAFALRGLALPAGAPLAFGALLGFLGVVGNYLSEWRARRSLAQLFGHYLPPERVRAMASDPERFLDIASSAENRELTVLFCDLRGFTPMAEHLAPERLREVLNLYFSRMSEIIHAHGGTLDKYIGDAVMAFWGAPQADPAHAAHAVQAARAMTAAVGPLNETLAARGLPALAPCIGLATGVVCVGDLGSSLRRSYTAVGDGVNLAARIEGLTRNWGVPLLVADATRAAAGELPGCAWVEVDEVAVKGRSQRVTLFVPLAVPGAAAEENAGFHEQLGLWRLAREAWGGHHGVSSQAASAQAARAVARARLAELLEARPPVPELHALAAHRLARLSAEDAAPPREPVPPESASA
jgi:adenylate cyclase